jgi:hypothetical protein
MGREEDFLQEASTLYDGCGSHHQRGRKPDPGQKPTEEEGRISFGGGAHIDGEE